MKFDPTSIGKAQNNLPPRIVLSGEPKAGKTTFAAKAPNPLFIPIVGEEGCDGIIDEQGNAVDVHSTPVVQSYNQLVEVLEWLATGEHDYKTVVIDSLSTAERMIWEDLCKADGSKSIELVAGGYGKGYTMTLERFRNITHLISQLREKRKMIAILISHVTPRALTDAELNEQYDAFDLSLNKKVTALFQQWADFMVFASKSYYITEDNKRVEQDMNKLVVHGKAHLPIGGRGITKLMPKEVELTWDSFYKAVKQAKTQNKEGK